MADYERLERLGEGNFGEVWLAYDQALDVNRAVKYVKPSRVHDPTHFYNEPRTLMELRHDNIVRVEDAGTEADGTLYIAMEYLQRGSVENEYRGRPVPLTQARALICDVCWGLEYAHNSGYVHRDIKPANILVADDGSAKISDFGLATRAPRGTFASPYGYLTHLAPEVFLTGHTNAHTDVYALGVTAYRIINGDAYLRGPDTEEELRDLVLDGEYPARTHYRPHVPTAIRRVINKAMHVDPVRRFQSAAAFRQALEALSIGCDWRWKSKRRTVRYTTQIGTARLSLSISETTNGRYNVQTRKRVGAAAYRRITKDSADNLTRAQMKSLVHRVLARYVTHGK